MTHKDYDMTNRQLVLENIDRIDRLVYTPLIREHDITYRSGIIFPSVTTVPFCKIQQVSIRQNPVSRLFGLYSVAVVNGAQLMTETAIPGLTRERAEEIKAFLIERVGNESK